MMPNLFEVVPIGRGFGLIKARTGLTCVRLQDCSCWRAENFKKLSCATVPRGNLTWRTQSHDLWPEWIKYLFVE